MPRCVLAAIAFAHPARGSAGLDALATAYYEFLNLLLQGVVSGELTSEAGHIERFRQFARPASLEAPAAFDFLPVGR